MGRFGRYWLMFRLVVRGGYSKAKFLKEKGYFKAIGEHCYFQPYNFGTEPHLISFGNNVHVASSVNFINHDISVFMFRYMDPDNQYKGRTGEISIGDNVFIGAHSTILYDVHIGNNVIIGAGSVVTKDIPDGVVAAGVPCKPIGKFDDYQRKLREQ